MLSTFFTVSVFLPGTADLIIVIASCLLILRTNIMLPFFSGNKISYWYSVRINFISTFSCAKCLVSKHDAISCSKETIPERKTRAMKNVDKICVHEISRHDTMRHA